MRRAASIALAILAAVPGRAAAQWRTEPMVIPAQGVGTEVLAERFATAAPPPAADALLVPSVNGSSSLRAHQALLGALPSPIAQPGTWSCVGVGLLAQNGGDARPDVAWCTGSSQLQIAFGDAPAVLRPYTTPLTMIGQAPRLTFARLHPLPRQTEVIAFPFNLNGSADLRVLDFDPVTAALSLQTWPVLRSITHRVPIQDEALTMRISANARSLGIDDLYVPAYGSVTLFPNGTQPGGAVQLQPSIKMGGTASEELGATEGWLPTGAIVTDVLGAGPLDVDFDGILDMLVVLSPSFHFVTPTPTGRLLWIKGTGNLADFATPLANATPWGDLTSHPDLQPLVDPAYARSLEIGGQPAFAVFDRGSDSVLVVTSDPVAQRLRVWRGSAAGRHVQDMFLADLAGSPAPDLVAVGTKIVDAFHAPAPPAILVFPDVGDASPELAWALGSPGSPARGEDHRMAVSASDADGAFTVDWMIGDPYLSPVSSAPALSAGAAHEIEYVRPGDALCDPPPQSFQVTVRATDDLGVFAELSATLDVGVVPPALTLASAVPPTRLVLPPGGTATTVDGSAWTHCAGPVTFTWGGSLFAAAAGFAEQDGPTSTRRTVDLPEASYAALLAIDPDVTLVASEAGLTSPPATLALDLDAAGLVDARHETDRPSLAIGEVALLRTTLRSRLGVALPQVKVLDVLTGLAPAGPARATGATIVSTFAGGAGAVLDALPGGGGEVVIELPVQAVRDRGGSAVEVRSSGDHLLTPAASAAGGEQTLPGCGCGAGGGGFGALGALALVVLRRARRSSLT